MYVEKSRQLLKALDIRMPAVLSCLTRNSNWGETFQEIINVGVRVISGYCYYV